MTGGGSGNAMRVETTSKQEGIGPFLGTGTHAQQSFRLVRKSLKNGNVPVSTFPVLQIEHRCLSVCVYRCTVEEIKEAVRWNIKVSKETDLTLRTYLGAQGMKKGDLSKFIEEAVRWRILNRTVQEIKARNADADPDELQAIVYAALREVRAQRSKKRKG